MSKSIQLSEFQTEVLKKVIAYKKSFEPFGLQVGSCRALERRGLLTSFNGLYVPTEAGKAFLLRLQETPETTP